MCLCRVSRTFKVGPAYICVLTGVGLFAISGSVLCLSCTEAIFTNNTKRNSLECSQNKYKFKEPW